MLAGGTSAVGEADPSIRDVHILPVHIVALWLPVGSLCATCEDAIPDCSSQKPPGTFHIGHGCLLGSSDREKTMFACNLQIPLPSHGLTLFLSLCLYQSACLSSSLSLRPFKPCI